MESISSIVTWRRCKDVSYWKFYEFKHIFPMFVFAESKFIIHIWQTEKPSVDSSHDIIFIEMHEMQALLD